jgi:CheY-like chemotaxis protein
MKLSTNTGNGVSATAESCINILLVEDNLADSRLTRECLVDCTVLNHLFTVRDGVEAIAFLSHQDRYGSMPRPDLILLDLNLPKKDGKEVLAFIKESPQLRMIPVVILTSSRSERDIIQSYSLHCNCYVSKPLDIAEFARIVNGITYFWFSIVTLPRGQTCAIERATC